MTVDTFIRRPILASVCSLVVILAGLVAIPTLPVAQYPDLAPPQVVVSAFYNGASAQVVETAVTTPLEQALNGVEGMQYMTSTSGNDGSCAITVVFDVTRNIDVAAVDVQNRVAQAEGRLPNEVRQLGVNVAKVSTNFVLGAGIYAENGAYDSLFISNYIDVVIKDALKRVKGVGDVMIFGADVPNFVKIGCVIAYAALQATADAVTLAHNLSQECENDYHNHLINAYLDEKVSSRASQKSHDFHRLWELRLAIEHDQFELRFGFTNGVRGWIVHSRRGVLARYDLKHEGLDPDPKGGKTNRRETVLEGVEVEAGDTIDFVVDALDDYENDNFRWSPVVAGKGVWKANADFAPPRAAALSPREQLAQVLLLTNEFAFIE